MLNEGDTSLFRHAFRRKLYAATWDRTRPPSALGLSFHDSLERVIPVSFLPNSLSVGVVQPFRGSVNFRFESYKPFGVAPGTYPHTITLRQANAFIFPIADLCTILLTALLAMYGRRIMYAIIDVILRGIDLTFLPEEAFYDGFCDFRLCDFCRCCRCYCTRRVA